MFLITAKLCRRRTSTSVLYALILGMTAAAIGQEAAPPPPEQAVDPTAVDQPLSQPATNGVAPELSKQQRKQQKQQRQQQRAASGVAATSPSMKDLFAGTVAAVVQASGGTLLTGVAQVVVGRLVDWFSEKASPAAATPDQFASALPAESQLPAPPSDPVQAMATDAALDPSAATLQQSASPAPGGIAAGLAFEVHRLEPGGATMLVDPAVHEFRTGERFVVFFRPSLPGRMDIYNINPAGRQSLIDTQELAAGQLTQLGPYEFTAATGDEQLRLVMQPCSTPQLVSATRDIVRVPDTIPAQSGLELQTCGVSATRSARAVPTRDIRKVSVEDGTQFALDPLSAQELASGQVAPREVTIRFRHL